jgi:DNA-binding MarR family transcriptional regulator
MAQRLQSPQGDVIPEVFFDAIAYLLPGLNDVAQRCGISIGEWIILYHLRRAGKRNAGGQPIMARQGLKELLAQRGFGDANISRLLSSLENKEHIRRTSLTYREREQFFGASHAGNRQVVVLQASGDKKIQEFKQLLVGIFKAWLSGQSVMTRRVLASASGIGRHLAERLSRRLGTPRESTMTDTRSSKNGKALKPSIS